MTLSVSGFSFQALSVDTDFAINLATTATDTVASVDSLIFNPNFQIADTIAALDNTLLAVGFETTDSIASADAATANVFLPRTSSDLISALDSNLISVAFLTSDTVAAIDSVLLSVLFLIADSITIGDATTSFAELFRSGSDSILPIDVASTGLARSMVDVIAAMDSPITLSVRSRMVADALAIGDLTNANVMLPRSVLDSATLLDAATRQSIAYFRAANDLASATDSILSNVLIHRVIADAVAALDVSAYARALDRLTFDLVAARDHATDISNAYFGYDVLSIVDTAIWSQLIRVIAAIMENEIHQQTSFKQLISTSTLVQGDVT